MLSTAFSTVQRSRSTSCSARSGSNTSISTRQAPWLHIVGADGSRRARDVAHQIIGAVASRIDVGRVDDDVTQLGKSGAGELTGHGVGQLGEHLLERVEVI